MHTPKKVSRQQDQFQQFHEKCICQICTCGRHHCPPAHTKFTGQTTHHHYYKPYNIAVQTKEPCHFQVHQRHYDPALLKTSYKNDYGPYKVQPQKNQNQYQYVQKKTPFYDQTEYKKSYVPFQMVVEHPVTCNRYDLRKKTKFQGTTTYTCEFNPKHIDRVQYSPVQYQKKKIPFEGQSMYHSQFKAHEIQISKPSVCGNEFYQPRKNKFIGESRYNEEFKPFKIEKIPTCPINLMPHPPKECSPGKTHLNYSAEKHSWQ